MNVLDDIGEFVVEVVVVFGGKVDDCVGVEGCVIGDLRIVLFLFDPLFVLFVELLPFVWRFVAIPSSSSPTVIATVAAELESEPICKRNEKKSVPI